jgi:VanZ family protein
LFLPPLLISLAIFGLSHQPDLPSTPGGDKTAHVVAYGVLAASMVRALYLGTGLGERAVTWASMAYASLYGVTDEIHQSFVPGREASALDVAADVAGAAIGVLIGVSLVRILWSRAQRIEAREP